MARGGTTFVRRVSFNEKLYLATDGQPGGFCVQIVVAGPGRVSFDQLVAAVDDAAAVHPGARVVLRGVLGWARFVADGPRPAVRRGPTLENDDDLLAPGEPLGPRLDPMTGPVCEVVWCPGPRTRLVFRCHHAVMDARGLLDFIEDVFRVLRDEPAVGADGTVTDTELVQRLVGKRRRPLLRADRRGVVGTRAAARSEVVARRIRATGAGQGLVARIAAALARLAADQGATPTRVMIPVDLRNYARGLRATGNLTLPLFIDLVAPFDGRALQTTIVRRLLGRDALRLDPWERLGVWLPLWFIRFFFGLWTTTHRWRGRFVASAVVSHVVAPPQERLATPTFCPDAFFVVPMADHLLPLVVAVASAGDEVDVIVSAPRALVDDHQLDLITDAIAAGLDRTG